MDSEISITLGLIKKHSLCPQMSKEKWLQIILYMQEKEWIHYLSESNKIIGMWGGWRVKEYSDKILEALPTEEEGDVLYIPFACSESKERLIFLREARKLVGVKEIVFNEHNKNGRLHKIKIRG